MTRERDSGQKEAHGGVLTVRLSVATCDGLWPPEPLLSVA
jgi:hypothetical protein